MNADASLAALLEAWEAGEAPTALMVGRWREARLPASGQRTPAWAARRVAL